MKRITVQVGTYDGSQKNVVFTGELLKTQREFDAPNDESRGTQYELYRVPKGYRVYEKRWANGQGHQKRQNYAKLSRVLTQAELLEKFPLLANYAGIIATDNADPDELINENEKTILLAANAEGTRLLPYTLANVEELIELAFFVSAQEDIPEDIQTEFKGVLERLAD